MKHSTLILHGREVRLHGRGGIVTAYVDGSYVRGMFVSDQGTARAMAGTLVAACRIVDSDTVTLVANRIAAVAEL